MRLIEWLKKRLVTRAAGPPPALVLAPPQEMPTAAAVSPLTDEAGEGDFDPLTVAWSAGYEAGVATALEREAERREVARPANLAALRRALASVSSAPANQFFGRTRAVEEYATTRDLTVMRAQPATTAGLNGTGGSRT